MIPLNLRILALNIAGWLFLAAEPEPELPHYQTRQDVADEIERLSGLVNPDMKQAKELRRLWDAVTAGQKWTSWRENDN